MKLSRSDNRGSSNTVIGAALVFLFPFISFLCTFRNMKSGYAYWIIGLFYLLFGLAFTPENEAADSYRYAEQFTAFATNPDANYRGVIDTYFGETSSTQGEVKDVYIYTMYYLAAKAGGNNVHVLFLLFSVVFTFFALKCLKYITDNPNYRNYMPMYILLFLFIYSNNIFNINGVRFWTASWIAVFIVLKILIDKRIRYIFLLPVLPLIHAAFSVFIVFGVIAFIMKSRGALLCKIYLISFFFGEVGLQLIEHVNDYMPQFVQNMIWSYTESDWATSRMDGSGAKQEVLYARILIALPRYYELGLLYLASRKYSQVSNRSFLGFTLAFFSCVNLCAMIPSMSRFYIVGYPFIIYIWVSEFRVMKDYVKYLYIAPYVYAYTVFRWVRSVISVTDVFLYISNVFHIVYRNLIAIK